MLPLQFTVRPPRREDAPAIVDLMTACQRADGDDPDMTVEELIKDWHGVDLDDEAILVLDADGQAVGFADLMDRRYVQVNVYPFARPGDHWEAVWAYLTAWGERWAQSHLPLADGADEVSVYHFIHANNRAAADFLATHGYALVRTHYIMEAQLDAPPPSPVWPAGIALRTFAADEDGGKFYEAAESAFQDMWNRLPSTQERWLEPTSAEGFDPTLWFLPYDVESGEIAAICLCSAVADIGMVDTLGVRPRWRRQGLGLAMLRHAFGEFWRRGLRTASLNVDADSPTGAPRLYGRAGFQVQKRIHRYEKKLTADG